MSRGAATAPLRTALAAVLPERPFKVELWDGTSIPATNGPGPVFRLTSPRALGHVLRAPGQLGVGRAYVTGGLEVDDIDAALALLDRWQAPPIGWGPRLRLAGAAVRAGALTAIPRAPAAELRPSGRRHSAARDRRAVRHHYDVSNEFFALFPTSR
jgi:cyclopropane-fatty-acyl-phospholipid synthase